MTKTAWKKSFGTYFNSGVRVIGRRRVALKTSKTTAWSRAVVLKLRKLPVAMKCQIKNQKSGEWSLPRTSAVTFVWLARLGWLPIQAKLPLHGDWRGHWTGESCQWPWNVKSRIGRAESGGYTYNFAGSLFCRYTYLVSSQLQSGTSGSALWTLNVGVWNWKP